MIKRVPVHVVIFAVFPILALLANNIHEVDPRVALRPCVISLLAMALVFLIWSLILRNWQKAGLLTTFVSLLFYTYGRIYELLKKFTIFHISLGRHRYLTIIYALLFVGGAAALIWKTRNTSTWTQYLNLVGMVLLVYPTYRVVSFKWNLSISERKASAMSPGSVTLAPSDPHHMPDVYFILLDTYTRGDALLRDFGYDNSAFLNELRDMGFYVADCSRSNADYTLASMTATLNMDYIPALQAQMKEKGLNPNDVFVLIRQNQVRKLLESIGYQTVAFDSGWEWTNMKDADVYLSYTSKPYEMQLLQPFESMLIRSSLLLIWSDYTYKSLPAYVKTQFKQSDFWYEDHINRQLYILEQLSKLTFTSKPKFVFAHIFIPHIPYVWTDDGGIVTNPRQFAGSVANPKERQRVIDGYVNAVKFVNSRIITDLQAILSQSKEPPIIVLMGDHGLMDDNSMQILNAYYLPGNKAANVYSTISPVNSFRLIFDDYFGAQYPLLPDISYTHGGEVKVETAPQCIQH